MAKKVAVIVTDEFEDIELTSPQEAIEEAGHEVVIIGDEANSEVVGKHGAKATVDLSIADAKPEDYDGLLNPRWFLTRPFTW
ncbi:intracellular protease amidase [Staphylococcus gallinarum]|uniref:Intracellular protease amidase n=1 Tax=Staphylococcus gallinarum TaxID=1293 RepID=A0A380FJZ1_STAGA|nr:intracellular protease amidase [Staphylococcus gallinarum]